MLKNYNYYSDMLIAYTYLCKLVAETERWNRGKIEGYYYSPKSVRGRECKLSFFVCAIRLSTCT